MMALRAGVPTWASPGGPKKWFSFRDINSVAINQPFRSLKKIEENDRIGWLPEKSQAHHRPIKLKKSDRQREQHENGQAE